VTDVPTIRIVTLVISIFDAITVSENVNLSISLPVSVFDSVTISEFKQISYSLPSDISDSVTVSENYSFMTKIFGYDISDYRPQGSLLDLEGEGHVDDPFQMMSSGDEF